eukprot:TRINITY_DN50843_c0_g1_i1.p1 TRINITY_DN50843_c0_g1~~TRINITY_DN50843_c0_g1_i1.p1  ORF type:complete len:442 (-),score=111.00 TRINITY_DN50843_c0_g1_i1:132-1457(-)
MLQQQLLYSESKLSECELEVRVLRSEVAAWGGPAGRRRMGAELQQQRDALRSATEELAELRSSRIPFAQNNDSKFDVVAVEASGWNTNELQTVTNERDIANLLDHINQQALILNKAHAKTSQLQMVADVCDEEMQAAREEAVLRRDEIMEVRHELWDLNHAAKCTADAYAVEHKRLEDKLRRESDQCSRLRAKEEARSEDVVSVKQEIFQSKQVTKQRLDTPQVPELHGSAERSSLPRQEADAICSLNMEVDRLRREIERKDRELKTQGGRMLRIQQDADFTKFKLRETEASLESVGDSVGRVHGGDAEDFQALRAEIIRQNSTRSAYHDLKLLHGGEEAEVRRLLTMTEELRTENARLRATMLNPSTLEDEVQHLNEVVRAQQGDLVTVRAELARETVELQTSLLDLKSAKAELRRVRGEQKQKRTSRGFASHDTEFEPY